MKKLVDARDTLTAEERLQKVINLQQPDRVPVAPFIYYFASNFAGITTADMMSKPSQYRMALNKCWDELGPWDIYYPVNPRFPELYTFIMPMKAKWPGRELPDDSICQLLEDEVMTREDYRWLVDISKKIGPLNYFAYFMRIMGRAYPAVGEGLRTWAFALPRLVMHLASWRYDFEMMKRKGATVLYGWLPEASFDTFSLARGLMNFVMDMRDCPEDIKAAADALGPGHIFMTRLITTVLGIKRSEIWVHRSSTDFISPKAFRELSFPSLKDHCEKLVALGINPILHCDGNWDMDLETLRELPAGNCIIQFDGPTNIKLAKEVIGDRQCIFGDVPPDMFCLASATEVDEYCHELIETVGKGGGFILGAGCEVPPNARPENVKAMIDSVFKYGYYS